jgi:hypothetical protein
MGRSQHCRDHVDWFTVDYRYNRADRLIGMTYPSGALIAYARSGTTGRVSSVSFQPHAGGPVTAIASGFTWQPFGAPTGYFAGNGTFHWRTYTLNGAPETVNGPGLASTYGVDVLGNIITLTSGATQLDQYDALNRLRRVDNASLQRIDAWTYDGTGNRLSRQAGQGPLLTLSYPPTSHRGSVAGVARSDDANGNTPRAISNAAGTITWTRIAFSGSPVGGGSNAREGEVGA